MIRVSRSLAVVLIGLCTMSAWGQGIPRFPVSRSPIAISAQPRLQQPFDVAGPRSMMVGTQDGVFESWIYPTKLLSDLRLEAEMADYPVPLDLNRLAANIEVDPAATIITYSHIAFTVKQIMFVPRNSRSAVVLFAIDSVRPLKLRVSFVPEMRNMWPAANTAVYPGWDDKNQVAVLSTDQPDMQGVVGIPGAKYEVLRPYQERAEAARYVLTFDYDPARATNTFIPMIMTVGRRRGEAVALYSETLRRLPQLYAEQEQYFDHYFDARTVVETPDERFNLALKWAMLAIEKSRVKFGEEEGLVAGYHMSGNTARPGFGWFFGRDTLWTLFAVNGYGDFELARTALDFLLARQRTDGKIMHEFSQSADQVDWAGSPYFYASADATPLLIIAMHDYLLHSGDVEYLRRNWAKIKLAYSYCASHDANHDGIYDNAGSGHGWVESGPLAERFQEIYLAALWVDALASMADMAAQLGEDQLAADTRVHSGSARRLINQKYWLPQERRFAFSESQAGELDKARTIFPAVAMWNKLLDTDKTGGLLDEWASHLFSTDWGTRILASNDHAYDPLSYHNGSVWPLFTGWVSLAEYRYGRPLAGYAHLRQNAMLTFAQDPAYATELLSGDFYQPFPRSSPHQMWSSAMVLTPFLRGTLGIAVNAAANTLTVEPQLPAEWDWVKLHGVKVGARSYDLEIRKSSGKYVMNVVHRGDGQKKKESVSSPLPRIRFGPQGTGAALPGDSLSFSLPDAPQIAIPRDEPAPGERTSQLKFLNYAAASDGGFRLDLEGIAGRPYALDVCATGKLSVGLAGSSAETGMGGVEQKVLHDCWRRLSFTLEGPAGEYVSKSLTLKPVR